MELNLQKGDITNISADAIVNAANSSLLGGGGVDGAIHRKGGRQILEACMAISSRQGGCKTGEAVITIGGNLPAKFVIHTVGPVWNGGSSNEAGLLKNCYINTLKLALQNGIRSIAFPNISTGIYGFPKPLAATIAISATREFIETNPGSGINTISFVCFDDENYKLYEDILAPQL